MDPRVVLKHNFTCHNIYKYVYVSVIIIGKHTIKERYGSSSLYQDVLLKIVELNSMVSILILVKNMKIKITK